ncbi:hypothetical protein GCM10023185_43410 [Hymenobacter saemangeumensis]|uniref:DUF4468 domain-containing protein n=1 Tax=Hymenobacter saemangeumensis TaxID=1084522 RepID=A0ABP8ISR8_9BACT
MKRPAFISWSCLLLMATGCQSTKSEETANSAAEAPVAAASPALAQAEALARRFGPVLRGAWVNAGYLQAVQQTRSPLQAAGLVGAVSELHLNPAARTGDSLVFNAGFANHEGATLTLYFRPGRQVAALPTSYRSYELPGSFTELSYEATARDTTLHLTTYAKNRQAREQLSFKRTSSVPGSQLQALSYAVQRLLFAGRYTGADSLAVPPSWNSRLMGA